jgi:putative membrane protein
VADEPEAPPPPTQASRRSTISLRAPSVPVSVGIIAVEAVALAALFGLPTSLPVPFLSSLLAVFLLPMLLGAILAAPIATALGGRLSLRRSMLLTLSGGLLPLPFAIGWRIAYSLAPSSLPPVAAVLLLLQAPMLWFRHMTVFGVSKSSHAASLPPSIVPSLLAVAGVFVLFPPTPALVAEAVLFLSIGFLAAALLLRAADRPMRREFGVSGVSLIRPIMEHINERDPSATEYLEAFFGRFGVPVDLRVTLIAFRSGGKTKATIALPTVHPGPFAALGSSNLPQRLAERLGPEAGTVFVPHTPCNHDLDLPTSKEFERVAAATQELFRSLPDGPTEVLASARVAPSPGSLARAQLLGGTVLVTVTQAPKPTDDIDFSIIDPIVRAAADAGGSRLAVVDAHNSYVEGKGDLSYGMPESGRLAREIVEAASLARSSARPCRVRAGVAVRKGYSLRKEGIAPEGIRALVVEATGKRTAYVLIDGNNLVLGYRARILEALRDLVDDAEVMTTDNHIVHEVDGATNAVGERYPAESTARDVAEVVRAAVQDLSDVTVVSGAGEIPAVQVLQPDWTARLLTSLGDTFSMFSNAFVSTFLIVATSSIAVLLAFR